MDRRIAKFKKVSYEQWKADVYASKALVDDPEVLSAYEEDLREAYDKLELPTRATASSAGYDFKAPFGFWLEPGETITIPTGICAEIDPEWCLICMPKSGLGFKYRIQLDNTLGLIDADYSFSDNEGHIMAKITNDGHEGKTMDIPQGKGFIQGVFIPYGITVDDDAKGVRNGGFGSTNS